MKSRVRLMNRLVDGFRDDQSFLGVIQVGSTTKGYADRYSDVDLEIIVTEEKYNALKKDSQKIIHTEKYDLIFTTFSGLQQICDSDKDEDHWNYQNSIVLLDKIGTIQRILNEITRYDEVSRLSRLKRYYRAFWENTLSSWSCLEHRNDLGARIHTALAVQALIRLLFNLNHLWAPRLQWAYREIQALKKKPAKFETQLENVLKQPETGKLSKLWNQTAELLRQEKYNWVDCPEELL